MSEKRLLLNSTFAKITFLDFKPLQSHDRRRYWEQKVLARNGFGEMPEYNSELEGGFTQVCCPG